MLKSITLHRPEVDNTGGFHDAGSDLIVGDDRKAGVITHDRAKDIVSGHGAAGHHVTPTKPRPARQRAVKAKSPAKAGADASATSKPDTPPVQDKEPTEPGSSD